MRNNGDMVFIPAGEVFYSDLTRSPGLVREDYYIDIFPVTNEQYRNFLLDHPEIVEVPNLEYVSTDRWDEKSRMYPAGTGDHPVVFSGSNISAFCAWRSQKDAEGRHFSLPSSLEWVKAAGGDRRKYWLWYANMWELTRDGKIFGKFSDHWPFDDPPWDAQSTDVRDDEIGFRCVARRLALV